MGYSEEGWALTVKEFMANTFFKFNLNRSFFGWLLITRSIRVLDRGMVIQLTKMWCARDCVTFSNNPTCVMSY